MWTSIPCTLPVSLWPLLARYMSLRGRSPRTRQQSRRFVWFSHFLAAGCTTNRPWPGAVQHAVPHGGCRAGVQHSHRRVLSVAKPLPAALPPFLWKEPPLYSCTARSRCVCSPCFASRGGLVFGGDARLCFRLDVPNGHGRVSVCPLPRSARCLCCRILFWFYGRFTFGRKCRRGCQRCWCCPRFAPLRQEKRTPPGGQTRARPLNAAPMPPGPEFLQSPACSRSGTVGNPSPPAGAAWQAVLPAALPAPAPRHLPW